MKKTLGLALAISFAFSASAQQVETERLESAGKVLKEVLGTPDDIPQDLLNKARCVIVFPSVLKAAFGSGYGHGRGAMTCRSGEHFNGPWGAPTMMALEGGSVGFQLGGQATDFVLLVMNSRGVESVLSSKVKLGAEASAAAGPKGHDAQAATDVTMRAEVLVYSRSRGLFAGVSLEGSTIGPDNAANKNLYGKEITAKNIVLNRAAPPPESARQLLSTLITASPVLSETPGSEGGTPGAKPPPPPPKEPPCTQ